MKPGITTLLPILGLLLCQQTAAQSSIKKIKQLILDAKEVEVMNPSTNQEVGDPIGARQSVGYDGSGPSRREAFEQKMNLTKTLERYVAFNPNADALFPGALVQGKSLPDGVLSPIVTLRKPLKITLTDLVSSNPTASFTKRVASPGLGTVTNAVSQILSQNLDEQQPARISYTETTINTIEQGFLKLGASYKWSTGHVSGSFNTSSSTYKNSFLVRLVQAYYTVSCEPPSSPVAFISRQASYEDFKNYADSLNPPTYVASVTYGRELWMLIETNSETREMRATFNAAFSTGFTSGQADLSTEQKRMLNESSIQVLILGGGGTPAVNVIQGDHVSGLKAYLAAGANYSKTSPGSIISYTVRYLKNNDVARVSSGTDYTIRTYEDRPEAINLTSMRITWDTNGDGKDWNTQPHIEVFDGSGRRLGQLACCSSDRDGDGWGNGRQTRNIPIEVGGLTKADLAHGRMNAWRDADGRDDWDYTAIVEFIFTSGSSDTHSCNGRNNCGGEW